MKIHVLNNEIVKPLKLQHNVDNKIKYKGFAENFDFGLRLQSYNLTEGLRDRKSSYGTSYFLSDLKSLSSVIELDVPYTFDADSKFTTYIKYDDNYLKADGTSIPIVGIGTSGSTAALDYDTNFNTLSSQYFFTLNLSTNEYLYITKEYQDSTYYAYCSSNSVYLSGDVPSLSSHLFRFNVKDNRLKLFPFVNLDTNDSKYQLILANSFELTACSSAGNTLSSVFEVNRNTLTSLKKAVNNSFSFYLSSFNKDDINLNLDTTIESVSSNFLLYSNNYSINIIDETIEGSIIPLKNQSTLEEYNVPSNHFNSQPENINRQYEKIFPGTNNDTGFDKLYLSYNIGTKDVHFAPSKATYFTTPSSLSPYTKLNINDSKIDYIGATPGNNPLLADKVFKRRMDIKDNSYSDDTNATYLCSWLSGNEDGGKLWVDRYYNPDFTDFDQAVAGTSFYNTVTATGLSSTYVFDVSSKLCFEPNNDYAYYHIGERDYAQHLISMERYLLSSDIEVLNNKGAVEAINQVKNDTEIEFNGDRFGKFVTSKKGDFSFSFWMDAKDYSLPIGYKILGNFFEEGFGIFNTELVTPNMYLPSGNKLLLMNNDLEVYDEIEILEEGQPVNIKGVARKDIFSEFYILGENNVVYIYNSNPNLVSKLTDLSGVDNLVIDDIDVTEDKIYLAFNPYGSKTNYFSYDINTNATTFQRSVSSATYGTKAKIHVSQQGGASYFQADSQIDTGNELGLDSLENKFIIKQKDPAAQENPWNIVYKNRPSTNTIELTGGTVNSTVTNVIVDDEDKVILLYDTNRIAKLKNTRELITSKKLSFLDPTSKKYIDLIYDFEGKDYKRYILIIENLSDRTLLHKLDFDFNLITTKSLGKLLNNLNLTKTVTGYYFLKKTCASKNRFKVKLKTKPIFTKTGAYKKKNIIIDYDISQLVNGYNHFAINVSMKLGYMELYVNGYKYQRVEFSPGKYALDNPLGTGIFIGALSTPYNLTLANRLLQRGKYFLRDVKMKGLKMYDRPIDYFEIKSHINYHGVNKDSVWALPIGQRVYTDTIDRVFKFNLPEKNTNLFDIEIKNLGINDLSFLEAIRDEFEKEVPKIIPFYDRLREIIFTAPISPDATPEIIRLKTRQKYLAPMNSCIIQEIEGQRYIKFVDDPAGEVVIAIVPTVICLGPIDTYRTIPATESPLPPPPPSIECCVGIGTTSHATPPPPPPPRGGEPPPTPRIYIPPRVGIGTTVEEEEKEVEVQITTGYSVTIDLYGTWRPRPGSISDGFYSSIEYSDFSGSDFEVKVVGVKYSVISSEWEAGPGTTEPKLATITVFDYGASSVADVSIQPSGKVFGAVANTSSYGTNPSDAWSDSLIQAAIKDGTYRITRTISS
tara:strand:+ start:23 stop:4135 length:4113 start_codon:yes stop_codon:yes gene_type:complete